MEQFISQMEVYYKMEGIKDLPVSVRLPFGKAWFAEYNGNIDKANKLLADAIEAEKKINSQAKK